MCPEYKCHSLPDSAPSVIGSYIAILFNLLFLMCNNVRTTKFFLEVRPYNLFEYLFGLSFLPRFAVFETVIMVLLSSADHTRSQNEVRKPFQRRHMKFCCDIIMHSFSSYSAFGFKMPHKKAVRRAKPSGQTGGSAQRTAVLINAQTCGASQQYLF